MHQMFLFSLESLAHLPALSASPFSKSPLEILQPHREVLNEHYKVLNVHFTDARCRCSFQDLSGTLHNVHMSFSLFAEKSSSSVLFLLASLILHTERSDRLQQRSK